MSANTVIVTADNWEAEVMNSAVPVIVDLWAEWCGPCKQIAPLLEEFGSQYAGKVKVAKVNVDEERAIAQAFDVQSIPTLAVVFQGGLVGKVVGFGGRAHVEQVFAEVAKIPEKVAAMATEDAAGDAAEPAPDKPEA
jgi:thioredoxin 1